MRCITTKIVDLLHNLYIFACNVRYVCRLHVGMHVVIYVCVFSVAIDWLQRFMFAYFCFSFSTNIVKNNSIMYEGSYASNGFINLFIYVEMTLKLCIFLWAFEHAKMLYTYMLCKTLRGIFGNGILNRSIFYGITSTLLELIKV